MDKNTLRQIRIKTNVLKRSIKDYNYYIDEANTLSEKVDQLKIDGGSEHYINKQTEVMQESLDMIPHVSHQL